MNRLGMALLTAVGALAVLSMGRLSTGDIEPAAADSGGELAGLCFRFGYEPALAGGDVADIVESVDVRAEAGGWPLESLLSGIGFRLIPGMLLMIRGGGCAGTEDLFDKVEAGLAAGGPAVGLSDVALVAVAAARLPASLPLPRPTSCRCSPEALPAL